MVLELIYGFALSEKQAEAMHGYTRGGTIDAEFDPDSAARAWMEDHIPALALKDLVLVEAHHRNPGRFCNYLIGIGFPPRSVRDDEMHLAYGDELDPKAHPEALEWLQRVYPLYRANSKGTRRSSHLPLEGLGFHLAIYTY